jgi:uncharacterized membrane protein
MYLLIKLLHIVAVIAFVGNIITGIFWHAHAARTRDPKLLAYTMGGIIRSDRLFTIPGVIGIIATGIAAAIYGNFPILRTGWILWTLILFIVSGLIFMIRVAPLQRQLRALAEAAFNEPLRALVGYRWRQGILMAGRSSLCGRSASYFPLSCKIRANSCAPVFPRGGHHGGTL